MMHNSNLRRLSVLIAAGSTFGVLSTGNAFASSNILQFTEQATATPDSFSYTDNGTSASISASDIPVSVYFNPSIPNLAPTFPVDALLDVSGTSTSSQLAGVIQSFDNVDYTFYLQSNPSDEIFSADATEVSGNINTILSNTGAAAVIQSSASAPSTLSLSSPYVNSVYLANDQGATLSLSNINGGTSPITTSGSEFNSFTADVSGTISAAPAPEMNPAYGFAMGAALLAGMAVFGRKAVAAE